MLDCFSVLPWLGYLICCLDDFAGFDLPAGLGWVLSLFVLHWLGFRDLRFVCCLMFPMVAV